VVLVIAPWNFPFMLTMGPLVSALAAGNRVFLKPSEVSNHTSALLAEMVADVFGEDEVVLFEGGVEVSQGLLALPFDHIFFTGSTGVGKIVMRAAAENLASVTLELGGKSPVIVDDTASLRTAAERIVWGKCINCGQACVAPDYVLVHENSKEELVVEMKKALERLFPLDGERTDRWGDLARVIDDRHFARLTALLENAVERGAVIRHGGGAVRESRAFEPTIVTDVDPDADLMHEEIFGPILPVLGFSDLEEALDRVSRSAKPLALYVFSRSQKNIARALERTTAGTSAVNDVIAQFVHPELPFGGVNHSGMGKAHGYHGFVELSNERPVLRQNLLYSNFKPIYPPYTGGVRRMIDALIRWL
jgi:aldehyde dehydrogenase (NAD+)